MSGNKSVTKFIFPFVIVVFALVAIRAMSADINDLVPTESWLYQIFQFISSTSGKTVLAISAGLTQLLMAGLQTPLAGIAGKWRLCLVALFSFATVILGGMASGLSLVGALASSAGLVALQVLAHQIYNQFFTASGNQIAMPVVPPVPPQASNV